MEEKRCDDEGKRNGRERECVISSRIWEKTCTERKKEKKKRTKGSKGMKGC